MSDYSAAWNADVPDAV